MPFPKFQLQMSYFLVRRRNAEAEEHHSLCSCYSAGEAENIWVVCHVDCLYRKQLRMIKRTESRFESKQLLSCNYSYVSIVRTTEASSATECAVL